MKQPEAKLIPYSYKGPFGEISDEFHWLREKDNPEVINFLNLENTYSEHQMSDTEDQQEALYLAMKSRIKEDDESYPYKYKNHYYFEKTIKDQQYEQYFRSRSLDSKPELLLDINILAKDKDFYDLAYVEISPDERYIAYAFDLDGDEIYSLRILDLQTDLYLDLGDISVGSSFEWGATSEYFFYNTLNDKLRPDTVFKYSLKEKKSEILYNEKDETFFVSLGKSKDERYLFIEIDGAITSEIHYLDLSEKMKRPQLVLERREGVEYSIESHLGHFLILSNHEKTNFQLYKSIVTGSDWNTLSLYVTLEDEVLLEDFEVFKDYIILWVWENAICTFKVYDLKKDQVISVPIKRDLYHLDGFENFDFDSSQFLFRLSSLATPEQVILLNLKSMRIKVLKEQIVPNAFLASDYIEAREWAESRDGVKIPVSLIYRKDLYPEGLKNAPTLIYGYGSYSLNLDINFSTNKFSLIDKGMVYVMAHCRGGSELGRSWYESGKYLNKKNSFYDFIDVTKYMIEKGYSDRQKISSYGGSAGGLLVAAAMNLEPDLYCSVVADVPFVDVLNTMLDDSLPLTTLEYDEWGNPNEKKYYDYIKSYSPYENIKKVNYPHLLMKCGLNDPRVTYWEPAKFIAKLRTMKTNDSLCLLSTLMEGGHSGVTGRYDYLKEVAFTYSFILKTLDLIKN